MNEAETQRPSLFTVIGLNYESKQEKSASTSSRKAAFLGLLLGSSPEADDG